MATTLPPRSRGSPRDEHRLVDEEAEVEQHADRHEEGGAEHDLQREDLGEGVGAVPAVAHDQAGQEGARARRTRRPRPTAGRPEAHRHEREQEDLGRAGPGHDVEHRGSARRAATSTKPPGPRPWPGRSRCRPARRRTRPAPGRGGPWRPRPGPGR